MKKIFSMGELFAGAGGIACGAVQALSQDGEYSIKPVWASDFNKDACDTYIANLGDESKIICKDVRDLDISTLGHIDCFAYGFPCNSFSSLGKRTGFDNDKFGMLYQYGIEVLNIYHPDWFMAENVSGIRSTGQGNHLKQILEDMENSGYVLVPHLYKFEEYGIPQTRHRLIIIGIRKDLDAQGIKFHIPSTEPYKNRDITARTALRNIPENAYNNEIRKLNEKTIERLSYIKPGQNAWTADIPDHLKINTKATMSHTYKKLDPDKPSYTVTASGGGGTLMYHWEGNRELTNRERARIQTFPDNYRFVGKYLSVRKQIGMAVPPEGARIIFNAVLDSFAGIKYPWIE